MSCNVSIDTNGGIVIEDFAALHEISNVKTPLYLYGNIMYFV